MSPKRAITNSDGTKTKKKRRPLTVAQKLHIIGRLERGERSKDIGAAMKLSSSTMRTIYLQKDKLREVAETCVGGVKLKRVARTRDTVMEKLERVLTHWIYCQNQQNINLSFLNVQEKALQLFDDLKFEAERDGATGIKDFEFKASKGWFERFKLRANLHGFRSPGEKASAAKAFPVELQRIVEEGGYSPKQIFNIAETGLYWKKLPSRTLITRDESEAPCFKESKDRFTLLLGGNLEGDIKLKPLMVYHSPNPEALKGLNKAALPVIWRFNKKAWITMSVLADYLTGNFSPYITSYCAKHNLDNKALLIIANAPGHSVNVEDYADNICVVFLPPNTASMLQPMDQGVIATFNAYYLQLVMKYLGSGSNQNRLQLKQLWKSYNLKMAIDNIVTAWNKVTQSDMNGVWKPLLPKCVHNFHDYDNMVEGIQQEIVTLALEAGLEDVDHVDVQEVLGSHSEKLTNEEFIELDKQKPKDDNVDDDDGDEVLRTLDSKTLSLLFSTCEKAIQIVEDNDPQLERSSAFKIKVNDAIACYRELYKMKKATEQYNAFMNFITE